MKKYYVYIVTNKSMTLYTGMTSSLERRISQHKSNIYEEFSSKDNISKPVYFEEYSDIREAIAREKQIKGWLRRKKIALVNSMNPEWKDLSAR